MKESHISQILDKYGDDILIAAHYYQSQEIRKYANIVGSSYDLIMQCAKSNAKFIILCGVSFVAQSISMFAKNGQKVILPDPNAKCLMAESIDFVTASNTILMINSLTEKKCAPVVYINSLISQQGICDKFDGSPCTGSNAKQIMDYYLKQDRPIFCYPNFYLALNCANELGIKPEEIAIFAKDLSLKCKGDLSKAKLFLYDSCCEMHQKFKIEHIRNAKAKFKDIKIAVHFDCSEDVAKRADFVGSSDDIYEMIKGSNDKKWAIGADYELVLELQKQNLDKTIIALTISTCPNMQKITLKNLEKSLLNIENFIETGSELNSLTHTKSNKDNLLSSLQTMSSITSLQAAHR